MEAVREKNECLYFIFSKNESYKDELGEHVCGLERQEIINHGSDRAFVRGLKRDDVVKQFRQYLYQI